MRCGNCCWMRGLLLEPIFWYDPVLADKLDTRWADFMSNQEDPQCNVPLYAAATKGDSSAEKT